MHSGILKKDTKLIQQKTPKSSDFGVFFIELI